MLKRLFVALVAFLYLTCAQATTVSDPAYANMQRAVGGIIEQTAQARGFSTTDPRTYGTLYGMGKVAVSGAAGVGAGALVAGTAPAWGTVVLFAAVSAGVSYAINLAIDGVIKWAFGDPSGSTPVVVTMPGAPTGSVYPGQQINSGDVMTVNAPQGGSFRLGNCTGADVMSVLMCSQPDAKMYCSTCVYGGVRQSGNSYCVSVNAPWGPGGSSLEIGCPGVYNDTTIPTSCAVGSASTNGGACKVYATGSQTGGTPTTSNKTMADAAAAIPSTELQKKVDPAVLAMLANELWRQAAAQPGYAGLPYSVTNPITTADVQAWQAANPGISPTVGDMLAPVSSPSTGLVPTSPSAGSATSPTPGTQTNPATGSPQVNLGNDPNIGSPNLESTPTATMILQPLLNLFPDLRSFVTPSHSAECPKPQFDIFGKVVTMDTQCTLAEGQRQALYAIMMLVWVIIALFIVLSA